MVLYGVAEWPGGSLIQTFTYEGGIMSHCYLPAGSHLDTGHTRSI